MISVEESAEWSPHGREVVGRHPQHREEKEDEQVGIILNSITTLTTVLSL